MGRLLAMARQWLPLFIKYPSEGTGKQMFGTGLPGRDLEKASTTGEGPCLGPLSARRMARRLRVAECALGGLKHPGAVLVLALVDPDVLDPGVVALGQHRLDLVHA